MINGVSPASQEGGRYTKKEQEKRKLQVYDLHFEQNKSAVEIATVLNINRNTINDDIKFWNKQIVSETDPKQTVSKMTKQIQRMEIQEDRLLEDLEFAKNTEDRVKIEKLISHINDMLARHFSKINSKNHKSLKEKVNEDVLREFVRELILSDEGHAFFHVATKERQEFYDVYTEDELKFNFIRKEKCSVADAVSAVEKMKKDGLVFCELRNRNTENFNQMVFNDLSSAYNIGKFTSLREYVTDKEFIEIVKRRFQSKHEIEEEENQKVIIST